MILEEGRCVSVAPVTIVDLCAGFIDLNRPQRGFGQSISLRRASCANGTLVRKIGARIVDVRYNSMSRRVGAEYMWVFLGDQAAFPSGIFSGLDKAEEWIAKHELDGILTEYPVDEGVYDWAARNLYFVPNSTKVIDSKLISRFTSSRMKSFHYGKGIRLY